MCQTYAKCCVPWMILNDEAGIYCIFFLLSTNPMKTLTIQQYFSKIVLLGPLFIIPQFFYPDCGKQNMTQIEARVFSNG